MKDESFVAQEVQIDVRHLNCHIMRNNSGACTDATGRPVRYGLGNISAKHLKNFKSSDYIGITEIIITPEMVGKKVGVFTAFEIKKESWNCNKKLDQHETAQNNFLQWVKERGGIAAFINSVDKARSVLREYVSTR